MHLQLTLPPWTWDYCLPTHSPSIPHTVGVARRTLSSRPAGPAQAAEHAQFGCEHGPSPQCAGATSPGFGGRQLGGGVGEWRGGIPPGSPGTAHWEGPHKGGDDARLNSIGSECQGGLGSPGRCVRAGLSWQLARAVPQHPRDQSLQGLRSEVARLFGTTSSV